MLKAKEKRDTILLIFMAIVTFLFLLYLFITWGEKDTGEKKASDNVSEKQASDQKITINFFNKRNILENLNKKIECELKNIYAKFEKSKKPFKEYKIDGIKEIFTVFMNRKEQQQSLIDSIKVLNKFFKFSFYDLSEILNLEFPENYNNSLKFNTFLSLFLLKIKEEGIIKRLEELSKVEFEKVVDFEFYRLVNNEVEKDYQSIPVLFYFNVLLRRLNIYQSNNDAQFFLNKIGGIKDLSINKHLIDIKELLSFNKEFDRFRVEWTEYDRLDPNDKMVFGNLNLKTITFLQQKYLIFPDTENKENNKWIWKLCDADSGDIELIDLKILNENPNKNLKMVKILYSPINSNFIIILNKFRDSGVAKLINIFLLNKISDFHKNFDKVDFSDEEISDELLKKNLERFGDYLKRNSKNFY